MTDIFAFSISNESDLMDLHREFITSTIKFHENLFPYKPHCTIRSISPVSDEEEQEIIKNAISEKFILERISVYSLMIDESGKLNRYILMIHIKKWSDTMKKKNPKLLYYLVWVIVGAILLHYGNSLISYYAEEAQKTYQLESTFWILAIVPFIYGVYLALLEGLPKAFVLNWQLLFIVFLPSFLLLIYPILVMYFNISNIEIYKFATLHDGVVFGLVSGLTLVKSLSTNHISRR